MEQEKYEKTRLEEEYQMLVSGTVSAAEAGGTGFLHRCTKPAAAEEGLQVSGDSNKPVEV